MYSLSKSSVSKLATCHIKIQRIVWEALKHMDITVIEGHRSVERQKELFDQGATKVLTSKHNTNPSLAIDIAPYPIDWDDTERFYQFGFFILGIAASLGIKLRWGGDWDGDGDVTDQSFNDLVHFELVNEARQIVGRENSGQLPKSDSQVG